MADSKPTTVQDGLQGVIARARAAALPPNVNQGALNVVLGKADDFYSAVRDGLDPTSRAYFEKIMNDHGGPLGAAPQAAAADAGGELVDDAVAKLEKAAERIVKRVGDELLGRLDARLAEIAGAAEVTLSGDTLDQLTLNLVDRLQAAAPQPDAPEATGDKPKK